MKIQRSITVLLLSLFIVLFGCINIPAYADSSGAFKDSSILQMLKNAKRRALSEDELLAIMESAAGHTMDSTLYVDMDHDGASELIGLFRFTYADDLCAHHVWYCSSDGKTCCGASVGPKNGLPVDATLSGLDTGKYTDVVINYSPVMGGGLYFSVLGLRDGAVTCLISNKIGNVYMSDEGELRLDTDDYDAAYHYGGLDGRGRKMGHSFKTGYLFFDGYSYKEYAATEISQEEFLTYRDSKQIQAQVDKELESDKYTVEYIYLRRPNGVMHVQCNRYLEDSIEFSYYTFRYHENVLDVDTVVSNYGQMFPQLSDIDAVY